MKEIVQNSAKSPLINQEIAVNTNGHPPTPINIAYLEFQNNSLHNYTGRNLRFNKNPEQFENAANLLKCEEELEIEKAREEIASLEYENAEIPLQQVKQNPPFNYSKNPSWLNSRVQNDYYQEMEDGLQKEENNLKNLYNKPNWENFIYVTYTDSQKSEEDGEPIVEYVSSGQNILSQYNPHTRTFFKCSIYSPSNRLYTVDEVNSTISEHEMSSQFKFSNKNQDSFNMTNSLITPCTPTPKVSKVMRTQKIRTKTDKFEQKMNMTFF